MQKQSSSATRSSVLDPTTPTDVGIRSQRHRIVEAMILSCAEKTYPATTITDIVGRASVSRTTFYKRFADKRECFQAALDACIEEVWAVAEATCASSDPGPKAVREATTATLELMAARPAVAQLLAGDAVWVDPSVLGRYRKLVIPALEGLFDTGERHTPPRLDPNLAFGRAQMLIFSQIATGRAGQLRELLPEIVYLAFAPFAGHREAVRQARLVEARHAVGDPAENATA